MPAHKAGGTKSKALGSGLALKLKPEKKKPAAPKKPLPLSGLASTAAGKSGGLPRRRIGGRPRLIPKVKLNMRPDGTISGISGFPGRPSSNLASKQGQHETAYVVHEYAMRNAVKDLTPKQAAHRLAGVAAQWLQLPSLRSPNSWNGWIRIALQDRITQLGALSTSEKVDELAAMKQVEERIPDLLSLRNKVPGSAVSKKGTKGHAEQFTSGDLQAVEDAIASGKSLAMDVNGANAARNAWALLDIGSESTKSPDQMAISIETHLRSIQSAFPRAWGWLSTDARFHLLPWLIKNRDSNFLKDVKPEFIRPVYVTVYGAMNLATDPALLASLA